MYQLTQSTTITRLSDGTSIPADPNNTDYAEYLQWVGSGHTPQPAPQPVLVVPTVVTMRQARLALLDAGLLDGVNTAIANLPSPQKEAAQIEWDYATEVRRDDPLVAMLVATLSIQPSALDALFTAAAAK